MKRRWVPLDALKSVITKFAFFFYLTNSLLMNLRASLFAVKSTKSGTASCGHQNKLRFSPFLVSDTFYFVLTKLLVVESKYNAH